MTVVEYIRETVDHLVEQALAALDGGDKAAYLALMTEATNLLREAG